MILDRPKLKFLSLKYFSHFHLYLIDSFYLDGEVTGADSI